MAIAKKNNCSIHTISIYKFFTDITILPDYFKMTPKIRDKFSGILYFPI